MPTGSAKAQQRRGQPGQRVQVCDHEIGILEIRKRPEAQENRQDQKQLRPPGIAEALDQPSENIALQDGDEHDRQIARLTPSRKTQGSTGAARRFFARLGTRK